MNVSTSYKPAQTHVRFYEKRYGHLDVSLQQYKTDQFVTLVQGGSYPMEVKLDTDMFFKLKALHVNSSDVAVKVDSCIATPSIMPASALVYNLIDHGCPSSPAVKLFPSTYDEVRFSVRAFEFRSNPGGVVYIHCQVSVCSTNDPQCVTGCSTRHRREVAEEPSHAQLVSGGPYLVVTEQGSVQAATVVAAVCGCIALVATVMAIIGWRRKPTHNAKI